MKFQYLLSILLYIPQLYAQFSIPSFRDDTLAMVDNHAITTRELFERISLMPFEEKLTDRRFHSIKRKAVESLAGEYILAQSEPSGDTSDWRNKYTVAVLERLFMRDALFKKEIREYVTISNREIEAGLKIFAKQRRVLLVSIPENERGDAFVMEWKKLRKKGIPHRTIFHQSSFRFDTVAIAFGSADSVLERSAFALKDTLEVSGPITTVMFGPAAIAMVNESPNPAAQGLSLEDKRKSVADAIRERKESQLQVHFFDSILRGQRMSADSALYFPVANALRELILRDTISRKVPSGYRYLPTDIYELSSVFMQKLDSSIVTGTFGSISLGIFLEHLYYYDFTVPSLRPRSFAVSFYQMLRAVTEGEMVAAEAERRGLKYDPDVRRDIAQWTNHQRSRKSEYRIADTVQVKDWEPFWSLWRKYPALMEEHLRFSIEEVLVKDSVNALNVRKRIQNGESMKAIAAAQSQRKEWKMNGGRSGWFSFAEHPELSAKLMMLPLGELSHPLKLNEGFSVVRVLEKKCEGATVYIDSLLLRESMRMRALHQKAAVTRYISTAAQRHSIQFYDSKIEAADIENVNMITRRTIGFGGRINAAPFLLSQWQWVEEWKRMKELNP